MPLMSDREVERNNTRADYHGGSCRLIRPGQRRDIEGEAEHELASLGVRYYARCAITRCYTRYCNVLK